MNFLLRPPSLFKATNFIARRFLAVTNVELVNLEAGNETDKLYKTMELECRGHDPAVLNSYAKFATQAGKYLSVEGKTWNLRKPRHERLTVLKSVHIYKKHRVQYELRTYFTFIQFKHLTGSTADTLLEYVERNLPEGVSLKVTKIELQTLPDYLKPPEKQET